LTTNNTKKGNGHLYKNIFILFNEKTTLKSYEKPFTISRSGKTHHQIGEQITLILKVQPFIKRIKRRKKAQLIKGTKK
jgi:hypothetical protein